MRRWPCRPRRRHFPNLLLKLYSIHGGIGDFTEPLGGYCSTRPIMVLVTVTMPAKKNKAYAQSENGTYSVRIARILQC